MHLTLCLQPPDTHKLTPDERRFTFLHVWKCLRLSLKTKRPGSKSLCGIRKCCQRLSPGTHYKAVSEVAVSLLTPQGTHLHTPLNVYYCKYTPQLCIQTAAKLTDAWPQNQLVPFRYLLRDLLPALVYCRTLWCVTYIRFMESCVTDNASYR